MTSKFETGKTYKPSDAKSKLTIKVLKRTPKTVEAEVDDGTLKQRLRCKVTEGDDAEIIKVPEFHNGMRKYFNRWIYADNVA